MKQTNGLISIRKDGSYGCICQQCHHLIKNKPEQVLDKLHFLCDDCKTTNVCLKSEIPKEKQNTNWGDLWKFKEEKYFESRSI
jgi:hypothetical protein